MKHRCVNLLGIIFVLVMVYLLGYVVITSSEGYERLNHITVPIPAIEVKANKTTEVRLANYTGRIAPNQVFFLETSGRGYLLPRQACTVESAARYSGLPVTVLIASQTLFTQANNATWQLFQFGLANNVSFHFLDVSQLVQNTPFEPLLESHSSTLQGKGYDDVTQLSDILRIAVTYKYGGFYSDLDVVFLQSVAHLRNVLGNNCAVGEKCVNAIPNGDFHFEAQHPFLEKLMNESVISYSETDRTSLGPPFWYKTLYDYCNLTTSNIYEVNNSSCPVSVLPHHYFYPVHWTKVESLFHRQPTATTWDQMFANSTLVHMYGYLSRAYKVTRNPNVEAYSYLAPTHCPLSYEGCSSFQ